MLLTPQLLSACDLDQPITVFIRHTPFPLPPAINPVLGREPLQHLHDSVAQLPPFISRAKATKLLWVPRGQAEVIHCHTHTPSLLATSP